MTNKKQTPAEEDYLKVIYTLRNLGLKKVSITAISEAIGKNTSSVKEMLSKLQSKGWVHYEKKGGAFITKVSEPIAVAVLTGNRIWKTLLTDKLKYSEAEAIELAEKLEHIRCNDIEQRIVNFILDS